MSNQSQPQQSPPPTTTTNPPPNIHTPFTRTERIEQLAEIDKDIASLLTHLSSAMRALSTPPPPSSTFVSAVTSPASPSPSPQSPSRPRSSFSSDSDSEQEKEKEKEIKDPQQAFQTAQTNFISTLDRIDKQLVRNIYALEEAGIITLPSTTNTQSEGGNIPGSQSQLGGVGGGSSQGGGGGGGGSFNSAAASAAAGGGSKSGLARLDPDGLGHYGKLDVGKLNMASSTLERDKEVGLWRKAREFLEKAEEKKGGGDKMQE
ncbi:mediator complex, subunit Med11 [Podospora fimiseda]|uniref:Mediator of RNA polymerase II transcription subunit 11 n=1 Tax=Podospora fimiseda TaxID=252190 RepID=A0AAN6YPN0_9PEZI|nr:mediator complex, subunit Med11 [Podospora fimiseda]